MKEKEKSLIFNILNRYFNIGLPSEPDEEEMKEIKAEYQATLKLFKQWGYKTDYLEKNNPDSKN